MKYFMHKRSVILSLVCLLTIVTSFVFYKPVQAAPYANTYQWDCFTYVITLDNTTYYPGDPINVTGSATNDGCNYDVAWIDMVQTVHNAGIDALSSAGNIGTQVLTAPATLGTHYLDVNTYRYFQEYVYADTYAPRICVPDNCGFRSQSCSGGWINVCWPSNWQCDQACTGGQRISHSVIGNCCGQGGDTARSIPFTVVSATASISASSGTQSTHPLSHNATTTITWNSTHVDTGQITVNGSPTPWIVPYYTTVTQTTTIPAQGYVLGPYYILGAVFGPYWVQTAAAYSTTTQVQQLNPVINGSVPSDKLSAGDNLFTFKGYRTGSTTPIVISTAHVYVAPSNIIVNISASSTSVNSGDADDISWSTNPAKADSCVITRNDIPGTWKTGLSGVHVATGPLTKSQTTFTATCSNSATGDSNSNSVSISVLPVIPPSNAQPTGVGIASLLSCVPAQIGSSHGNIYLNKAMTWTMVGLPANLTGISTAWSVNGAAVTTNNASLSHIYTKVGSTTINAVLTATLLGQTFTALCSTSTIIYSNPGVNTNI